MDTRRSGWTRWDPFLEAFLAPRLEVPSFVWAHFQVTLFFIFESKFGRLGLLNPGFRKEPIAKIDFAQKAFSWI